MDPYSARSMLILILIFFFFVIRFCKNKNAMYYPAVISICCFLVSSALGIQKWVELVDWDPKTDCEKKFFKILKS